MTNLNCNWPALWTWWYQFVTKGCIAAISSFTSSRSEVRSINYIFRLNNFEMWSVVSDMLVATACGDHWSFGTVNLISVGEYGVWSFPLTRFRMSTLFSILNGRWSCISALVDSVLLQSWHCFYVIHPDVRMLDGLGPISSSLVRIDLCNNTVAGDCSFEEWSVAR